MRGGWVVKKGQKYVYVVIECPPRGLSTEVLVDNLPAGAREFSNWDTAALHSGSV